MEEFINFISGKRGIEPKPEEFSPISPSEGTLIFIDGGNAELIAGPDFSINFIRVAGVIFSGRKRITQSVSDFYCLFYTSRENEKLVVKTKLLPLKGKISINESELEFHFTAARLGSFADVCRRILEINLACDMLETSGQASVVLDGSLETKYDIEKKAIEKLKALSMGKNCSLCALSKTTSLVNKFGDSVHSIARSAGPQKRWYLPVLDSDYRTFFVKLHPSSTYIFRCDTFAVDVPGIFGNLSFISNDPVFLGYPYGLIEADRIARVSNRETEMLRIELSSKMGRKWVELEEKEKALNAHGILDTIR